MSYVKNAKKNASDPLPNVRRIDTPADIATGAGGEPAWVEFKVRIKGKYLRTLNQAERLGLAVTRIDEAAVNETNISEVTALAERAFEAFDKVHDVYAAVVVAWNWLDSDTGEPLPPPDDPLVFQDELDQVQIGWIRRQIDNLVRYRATEGNGTSGSA